MMKKQTYSILATAALILSGLVGTAHAASVVNGASCAKTNATITVKVKGVSKTYICKVNPIATGAFVTTWTLKTCLSYWAAAQNSQDSITEQRSLVRSMSEPDKTSYTKQLDASQASLDKVKAAIVVNHCKAGL
jgi:hypothetical protein